MLSLHHVSEPAAKIDYACSYSHMVVWSCGCCSRLQVTTLIVLLPLNINDKQVVDSESKHGLPR